VVKPVRLLIADDSASSRAFLTFAATEETKDSGIVVVGEAKDGDEVVHLAYRLHPDVISMDVRMPKRDGIEATRAIMASAPSRVLIVTAVDDSPEVDLSFRAMAEGALELIAKPKADEEAAEWSQRFREAVRLMAEVPVVRRRRANVESVRPAHGGARVEAMAIAASTGGPPAIAQVLSLLPATFPIPIIVAQHMAVGFVQGFARWLARETPLAVVVATHGEVLRPRHVYLPPDGGDGEVDGATLSVLAPRSMHFPSADRVLTSLARSYGSRALAVVLSGMGDDGARGTKSVLAAGGVALAQDEASSIVYGMPRCAVAAGAEPIALADIPAAVMELVKRQ
jgi:two-component system chemotaxis response regulator CheB